MVGMPATPRNSSLSRYFTAVRYSHVAMAVVRLPAPIKISPDNAREVRSFQGAAALQMSEVLEKLHDGEAETDERSRRSDPRGQGGLESHAGAQPREASLHVGSELRLSCQFVWLIITGIGFVHVAFVGSRTSTAMLRGARL